MSFLRIPNELVLLVGHGLLHPADLSSLCRANHRLHSLLTPLLHSLAAGPRHGVIALHWGAAIGNEALVRIVMERGAGVSVVVQDDADADADAAATTTVLHTAPAKCDPAAVGTVMRKAANIVVRSPDGRTSLHWAVTQRRERLLRELLELGAPAHSTDRFGGTALHIAAAFWGDAPVGLLVRNGADLEARYGEGARRGWGQTALHQAVSFNNKGAIKQLLEAGADVDSQDADEQTPLHIAAVGDDISLVKLLLKGGADPDIDDIDQCMAIDLAMPLGHTAIIMLLLCHVNERFQTAKEETALHIAASEGYKSIIGRLLDNGVDIDAKDELGQTALHLAVINQHYGIAKALMFEGADYETIHTPTEGDLLGLARSNGVSGRGMVEYILEFGADDDQALEHEVNGHQRRQWS